MSETLIIDDAAYETRLTKKFARRRPWAPADPNRLGAFIPGVVRAIGVRAGQRVGRGESLLVLEAMKMQNDVTAPRDVTIKALHVAEGDTVAKGQLLIEFE